MTPTCNKWQLMCSKWLNGNKLLLNIEIKHFLKTTGALNDGAAPAPADGTDLTAPAGTRDTAAENSALMKELGLTENAGAGAVDALSPEKIKILQDALARQGADPAIQAALDKVANGKGKMSDAEMQGLLKSLKLDQNDPNQDPP